MTPIHSAAQAEPTCEAAIQDLTGSEIMRYELGGCAVAPLTYPCQFGIL
jgi:hypothetical protein